MVLVVINDVTATTAANTAAAATATSTSLVICYFSDYKE